MNQKYEKSALLKQIFKNLSAREQEVFWLYLCGIKQELITKITGYKKRLVKEDIRKSKYKLKIFLKDKPAIINELRSSNYYKTNIHDFNKIASPNNEFTQNKKLLENLHNYIKVNC